MSGFGDFLKEKSGLSAADKSLSSSKEQWKAATGPEPPTKPNEPVPPADTKHAIAAGLKKANQGAQAINSLAQAASSATSAASFLADPASAIAGALGSAADEKMNSLVSGLAKAIGPFPAATMLKMALGIPHAHVKHPPSGPPPLPPIPLPPMGPQMIGNCVSVLINSLPSARCGDWGFNPTCCGIVPPLSALFEVVTGSSNVYIGGARAARANIDITMHCFNIPSPKITIKSAKLAKIASVAGKVSKTAGKVASAVGKVSNVAGKISQATQMASAFADAEANDDAAMASAIGLSAAMMAAQAAADAAASAMSKQMGTDQPCIPPIGTPGMFLMGSPNVMLGGFPLPSFQAIAQGIAKRLKGIKFEAGGAGVGCPACK